jgi:hypothetical protein
MWDIVIAAGVASSQLIITWYGVNVSVAENRFRNAIVIGSIGAAGIFLTVWGTVRAGQAQTKLEAQLEKIQKQTAVPPNVLVNIPPQAAPIVNVRPSAPPKPTASVAEARTVSGFKAPNTTDPRAAGPWLTADQEITANLVFSNSGPARADDVRAWGRIYLVESDPNKTDPDKLAEKSEDARMLARNLVKTSTPILKNMPAGKIDPNPSDYFWITAHSGRAITQEDIDKLQSGSELLFLLYIVQYRDPAGEHYIHSCKIVQPPAFKPEIWQFCSAFEEHR